MTKRNYLPTHTTPPYIVTPSTAHLTELAVKVLPPFSRPVSAGYPQAIRQTWAAEQRSQRDRGLVISKVNCMPYRKPFVKISLTTTETSPPSLLTASAPTVSIPCCLPYALVPLNTTAALQTRIDGVPITYCKMSYYEIVAWWDSLNNIT